MFQVSEFPNIQVFEKGHIDSFANSGKGHAWKGARFYDALMHVIEKYTVGAEIDWDAEVPHRLTSSPSHCCLTSLSPLAPHSLTRCLPSLSKLLVIVICFSYNVLPHFDVCLCLTCSEVDSEPELPSHAAVCSLDSVRFPNAKA